MTAEVIAIGSELTCGARLDTNSQWLSHQLEALGWTVARHTTLADSIDVIADEFRRAAARSQVVIITGGLGPTLDDITRDALAGAFDQPLILDRESLAQIEALFAARSRPMPERNLRQAERPRDATAIPNSCGTAPGVLMHVVTDQQAAPAGCLLAALPGVPAEMKIMFADHVVPRLTASGMVVDRTQIRTFGLGESEVEQRLGDLTARGRNPEVGITASEAVITLSITARAGSAAECQRMIDPVRQQIEQLLGPAVFGMGESDLHECLAAELRRAGLRIACLEGAATGGLIAHWLCDTDEHEQFLTEARFLPAPRNGTGSDAATEAAAAWDRWFREVAANQLAAENVDFVVLTSSKWDSETPGGVRRRHGYVAVAGAGFFEMHDVTMSGNLSIFRGRAARTALNCLRLNAIS